MPRPRFKKLPAEKRERILEAAAKEFTAHGYDGASLNRILDEAGISKGAAYYYFDDKADLYATAVQHYSQELLAGTAFDPTRLTAENFWDELADLYRQQFIPMVKNMKRKMKSGKFNASLAPKLLLYLVDNGARKYTKEMGGQVKDMFPKDLRMEVAKDMARDMQIAIENGEYDNT